MFAIFDPFQGFCRKDKYMSLNKNKIFLFTFICIMLSALFVLGASADDETPTVPIDPPDVVSITVKEMPLKTKYIVTTASTVTTSCAIYWFKI